MNQNTTGLKFETEGTLLTESGDPQIDNLVNDIKGKVLLCLKMLWSYLIKKKPKDIYSSFNTYVQSA